MKNILAALAFGWALISVNGDSYAGELPRAQPEEVGLSSDRLKHLDAYMQDYIDRGKLAGLQLLVARHGKVAYFNSVGMAEIDTDTPLGDDSIFRIHSMTKPITSVAVMMLYEEGKFLLTDPVSKYIPEFKDLKVYVKGDIHEMETRSAKREMTIQDLLRHTSGLGYDFIGPQILQEYYKARGVHTEYTPDPRYSSDAPETMAGFIANAGKAPLAFDPGSRWSYSIATDVLAYLIEVISGQSPDAFFRDRIFGPLEMVDTAHQISGDKLDRFVAGYATGPDGKLVETNDRMTDQYSKPPPYPRGGSGLVSTSADYFRFAQMLLNGGQLDGVRLLSPRTIAFMAKDHLGDVTGMMLGPDIGFGLGFAMIRDQAAYGNMATSGAYFWAGAGSTLFWVDPTEDIVVIQMAQHYPARSIAMKPELEVLVNQAIVAD